MKQPWRTLEKFTQLTSGLSALRLPATPPCAQLISRSSWLQNHNTGRG